MPLFGLDHLFNYQALGDLVHFEVVKCLFSMNELVIYRQKTCFRQGSKTYPSAICFAYYIQVSQVIIKNSLLFPMAMHLEI